MHRIPPLFDHSPPSPFGRAVDRWLSDGRAQGHSTRTIGNRRHMLAKFAWWLENEEGVTPALEALSPARMRAFLTYLREPRPAGRFGGGANTRAPARPSTADTYYRCLRTFVNFLLAEGDLDSSPMRNVKPPRVPKDRVQPFSQEEVRALLDAARRSQQPERNVALLLTLLDTGLRASELCGLTVADFSKQTSSISVIGKGNKRRSVYLGVAARRCVWKYIELHRNQDQGNEPMFISRNGDAITPSGLYQIIQQLGIDARLSGPAGCHKLRHTFAINFLRGGGNLFELQQLMGHEDLTILRRYVSYAETDLETAHRKSSPADRMGLR